MQKPEILSIPTNTASVWPAEPGSSKVNERPLVFDACHIGVLLRAMLFVETVVAVTAMFHSVTPLQWLSRLAVLTAGAFPATLLWLVVACMLKNFLQTLPTAWQYAAGVLLGALAGLYGCGILTLAGITDHAGWIASAFAGALLSALLVAALVLRARSRTPAETTARLAELQSRIRPHFLFNTLNSAIALVRQEPAKAEAMLEDLSDLFRHALIEQGESVTLEQEIYLAQRYLAIEQIRFGDRLKVQWSLDPRANHARLPPLLLQPLVENAVKHGVEPSASGGNLQVMTEIHGSKVLLHITNTLPSHAPPHTHKGNGIALANVQARLALLHDVESDFSANVQDDMFQVRITLPYKKHA